MDKNKAKVVGWGSAELGKRAGNEIMINLKPILILAGVADQDDEISSYRRLPKGVQSALADKMKDQETKAAAEAADEIIKLLKISKEMNEACLNLIHESQYRIDCAKLTLEEIEIAKEYGMDSNNFIPLLMVLTTKPGAGMNYDPAIINKRTIPESFRQAYAKKKSTGGRTRKRPVAVKPEQKPRTAVKPKSIPSKAIVKSKTAVKPKTSSAPARHAAKK